jgi:hypothetical protein
LSQKQKEVEGRSFALIFKTTSKFDSCTGSNLRVIYPHTLSSFIMLVVREDPRDPTMVPTVVYAIPMSSVSPFALSPSMTSNFRF